MNTIKNFIKLLYSLVSSNYYQYDDQRIKTNYECSVCRSSGNPPNILGKFIKINDLQEQCNGCKTIYNKVNILEENIPIVNCVIITN